VRPHAIALWSALALAAAGCGGGTASAPPVSGSAAAAPAPAAAPRTAPVVMPKDPEPGPPLMVLEYDPKGRRDPFAPVSVAREKSSGGLTVTSVKLAGVIRGRTLLALVEAPDGLGYILKTGDVLGDGRVTDVTGESVTFAIPGRPGQPATAVTLRLPD
jgi:Tfp pilus assembly protein PilP